MDILALFSIIKNKKMHIYFKAHILFVLMIFNLSTTVYAEFKFEHISVTEGLSQSVVSCILQDNKGFMWFCTEDGLNKYDGYKFTVYKHDPDNPNSLSANYIWSIHEDDAGILWIATSNGLDKFDSAYEKFVHYRHDDKNPNSLSHNDVRGIYQDRAGILWIGTYGGGLNKFDRNTGKFVRYQHDEKDQNSLSHNKIYWKGGIYEDSTGSLWIGTYGGGLNHFDQKSETFVHYQHDANDPNSLSHNILNSIYEDSAGSLWIGTAKGLNKFDKNTKSFKHYLNNSAILSIHEKSPGVLWIGTDGEGLYQLNQKNETWTHYQYDVNNPDGLSNNYVNTFYQDKFGGLWLGTWGGLNKLDKAAKKFKHYRHTSPSSLSGNMVWTIYEDSSKVLWIGTEGDGLNKFDRKTGNFLHYRHDQNNHNTLINNDIYGIAEDDKGILWIATWGGLDKFDPKTETFVHYQHEYKNTNSLIHNNVYAIYKDSMGLLWIGTWGYGLNKFDPKTETFVHYKHDENQPNSLSDNQVNVIYEDSKGTLWLGTVAGLDRFDPETETFVHYQYDGKDPNSLSNGQVYTIYEDSRGLLWIGTAGGGLNKFNRATNNFTHYREKDNGISNDTINHILEDGQGKLWLSTNKGISRFDPKTGNSRNYDVNDGLQSNEFRRTSGYKTHRGELLFGGTNGFNLFKPEEIKDNPFIPPVVITDFKIFNKPVSIGGDSLLQQDISLTKELTLSYFDNVFSFEFVALNYTSSQKNQYAYKMEGVDKDWVYVDSSRRFVTYTHLDANDYIFKVRGSNNDGIWNEEETSIKITVTPPWWETWWAYLFYVIAVLSVILSYIIKQHRKLERERAFNAILEKKVAERTADLQQANTLIRKVFGRYLSREIVDTLLETKSGLALGGERRGITILTSDLRGFTARSNQLGPEQVIEIINLYLEAMAKVITEYQGTIDEFMGDGILVLFGAPIAREDDAERAVACAVAMQLAMNKVNEELIRWGCAPLEMGIGINTGEVVVGNIGSEIRTKYGVIGNEVNLTYRIESYTTSGQIFISEATFKTVGEIIKVCCQKEVKPKGIKQTVNIYEVEGIGGKHNLCIEKMPEEVFLPLKEKIQLQYRILEGKHIGKQCFNGKMVKISAISALIRCEVKKKLLPKPLDNIVLNIVLPNSSTAPEDIYAKVLSEGEDDNTLYIRFSSIPTDVKAQLAALTEIE